LYSNPVNNHDIKLFSNITGCSKLNTFPSILTHNTNSHSFSNIWTWFTKFSLNPNSIPPDLIRATFFLFIENHAGIFENLNIPLKRKNIDKTKNKYGNMLLNFCKANQLFIVNSRIGDDKG
jgi:hypothetical protein